VSSGLAFSYYLLILIYYSDRILMRPSSWLLILLQISELSPDKSFSIIYNINIEQRISAVASFVPPPRERSLNTVESSLL
jgi:hypothetical protein